MAIYCGLQGIPRWISPNKAQQYNAQKNHQAISFWASILTFEGECHFSLVQRSHTFLQPQKNRRQIAVSRLAVSANSAAQSVPMATHPFLGLDHLEPFPAASTVMWLKQCHKPPILGMVVYTTYKNADDWGMVYGIVLPTLEEIQPNTLHGPAVNNPTIGWYDTEQIGISPTRTAYFFFSKDDRQITSILPWGSIGQY